MTLLLLLLLYRWFQGINKVRVTRGNWRHFVTILKSPTEICTHLNKYHHKSKYPAQQSHALREIWREWDSFGSNGKHIVIRLVVLLDQKHMHSAANTVWLGFRKHGFAVWTVGNYILVVCFVIVLIFFFIWETTTISAQTPIHIGSSKGNLNGIVEML